MSRNLFFQRFHTAKLQRVSRFSRVRVGVTISMSSADTARATDRLYRAGVAHHLAERFEEAIVQYDAALELQPAHAAVLHNHGGASLRLAQQKRSEPQKCEAHWQAAERSMKLAIELAPSLDAYLNLGILYKTNCRGEETQLARLEEALAAYRSARTIAPKKSDVHERLGAALLIASDTSPVGSVVKHRHARDAAEAFRDALEFSPAADQGALWERRGDAHLAVAVNAQAQPGGYQLAKAHEDWPRGAATANRAEVVTSGPAQPPPPPPGVVAAAAYAEAVASFTSATRLQPESSGAYAKLAMAIHGVGLQNDPSLLKPLLDAMGQLQRSASDGASRVVAVAAAASVGMEEPSSGQEGEGGGQEGGGQDAASLQEPEGAECPAPRREDVLGDPKSPSRRPQLHLDACEVEYDGSDLPGQQPMGRAGGKAECRVRAISVRVAELVDASAEGEEGVRAAEGENDVNDDDESDEVPGQASLPTGTGRFRLLAAFATPVLVYTQPGRVGRSLNAALVQELLLRERRAASVQHSNRGGWQSASDLLTGDRATLGPSLARVRTLALDAASAFVRSLHAAAVPSRAFGRRVPRLRLSVLNSWANINRFGDSNLFHDHPQAVLSGVYFVADGSSGVGSSGAGSSGAGSSGRAGSKGKGSGAAHGKHGYGAGRSVSRRPPCGWAGGNGSIELIDPRYSLRMHRPPEQFEPQCAHLGGRSRSLRNGYLFEYAPPLQLEPTAGTLLLFPAWLMHRVRRHSRRRGVRVSISFNIWLADEDEAPGGSSGASGIAATQRLFDAAGAMGLM